MKTTLKSLEKRINELEFHEKNAIKILEDIDNRIEKLEQDNYKLNLGFSCLMSAKNGMKIETLPDDEFGPQPTYKIDQEVYFIFRGRTHYGKIMLVPRLLDNYSIFSDNVMYEVPEKDIIGYAKPDLLTQKEKEYLSSLISPFRNSIGYIERCICGVGINNKENKRIAYFDFNLMPAYKFEGLDATKQYTLQELGL